MTTHIRKRQVDPVILDRLTDGFIDFLYAVVQAIENEDDWGARNIVLRYRNASDGTPCFSVIGDGYGMGQEGRETYTRVCGSLAKGQEGKKGRNGTGRLGFIHHAAKAIVFEKAAGGRPHRIELTRQSMFNAWFGEGPELSWERVDRLPADVPINGSGVVTTWYGLGTGDGVARRDRKPKRVVEGLAQLLSPHVARKVSVEVWEGETLLETHRLKERKIEGKPIEGELHKVSLVGDVVFNLYVVSNPDKQNDQLMVGAMGPVCSWGELSGMFRRDTRYAEYMRGIEPVLGHAKVVGLLDLPVLNNYAVNNRKAFSSDLLEDEERCLAILGMLRRDLVPRVERELGLRAEEIFTTDDATIVSDICRDFQGATGEKPERGLTIADIRLNRHRVDLEPGASFVFVIGAPKPGTRYVWDDAKCGGTLDAKAGTRVKYTANQLGTHALMVREFGDASGPPVAEITIKVVTRLPLGFTKNSVSMSTNDRRVLRLENVHNTSEDLVWTFEAGWGCTPSVSEDLTECTVVSGDVEGTWDVTVRDRENPEETVAVCTVTVREGAHERPDRRKGSDTMFVYEGHTYEVLGSSMPSTSEETSSSTSWLEPGDSVSVITVNFGHAIYAGLRDDGRKALARREVFLRIAQRRSPNLSAFDLMREAAIIGARLMQRVQAAKA